MNRRQALRLVADRAALVIETAMTNDPLRDTLGIDDDTISAADAGRLEWATDEVTRRLRRMGGRETERELEA